MTTVNDRVAREQAEVLTNKRGRERKDGFRTAACVWTEALCEGDFCRLGFTAGTLRNNQTFPGA